jgi:hypothetical protein
MCLTTRCLAIGMARTAYKNLLNFFLVLRARISGVVYTEFCLTIGFQGTYLFSKGFLSLTAQSLCYLILMLLCSKM